MTIRCPRGRPFGRRSSALLVAALLVCACGAVEAAGVRRPAGGGRAPAVRAGALWPQRVAARQERVQAVPRGAPQREPAPAPPPAPPVVRPPEAPPGDRGGMPGRLTPDERRALRQQINDAGRDIYRAPRP